MERFDREFDKLRVDFEKASLDLADPDSPPETIGWYVKSIRALHAYLYAAIDAARADERRKCANELDDYAERYLEIDGITEQDAFVIKMSAFMLRAHQEG